ncbi:hypothetical protein N783_21455 [Pontibacillus marinus BH030004 = DSM 16465]|uniref:SelT/SelW/SelH family protein n=1 Tax=Pontibacillus marinus BH030004 = DSM 16465 TaxID=1385511 RepID=A0A0A5HJL6_9BACI|nr:hypothetical protein N783_21455 [Pontibacillus marinus BH030004 = DSM 16465]
MFSHFRHDIEEMTLVPSSGGAFEVTVNGEKIYSKLDTGEFPNEEELFSRMSS